MLTICCDRGVFRPEPRQGSDRRCRFTDVEIEESSVLAKTVPFRRVLREPIDAQHQAEPFKSMPATDLGCKSTTGPSGMSSGWLSFWGVSGSSALFRLQH